MQTSMSTIHLSLLLFVCLITRIFSVDTTPCSAINTYVHITSLPSTHLNGTTLLSSHALFAPHSYYVPSTPLVSLDATVDDICDPIAINTNISNKIVLLFESTPNCSAQYKAYVAQQNGARAVLMVSNQPTDEVVPIAIDDASLPVLTIPMRGISLEDGESLLTQIELGNAVIFGEFGCFDSEYPASLCLTDSIGEYWYADGEYQRMGSVLHNSHPVWMKDGVTLSIAKLYIYLHVGDGDDDWSWVISYDPFFLYEEDIRLKCTTSVHDPSLCSQWIGIHDPYHDVFYKREQSHFCAHYSKHWGCDDSDDTPFESAPGITISSNLCAADTGPSSRLCITSPTKALTPFMGEYYQYNAAQAIWLREMNACDHKPGALLFDGVGFALLDPLNRDFIASCFLETSLLNSSQFDPSACVGWKSIHDHSYNEDNLVFNDAFTVTMGECVAPRETCEPRDAPDALCMTSNSVLNGILSGTFIKTNVSGPMYGSPEYKRTTPMIRMTRGRDPREEEVDLYIWYRNEMVPFRYDTQYEDYPDYRNWVIADRSLTSALEPYDSKSRWKSKMRIYGICDGFAYGNPLDCKHWSFKAQRWQYLRDDKFEMFEIESRTCPVNTAPVAPATWPQYICVGLKDEGVEFGGEYSKINSDFFVGGYTLWEEKGSDAWKVKWIKRVNDNWDFEVFIDYDLDRGTWEIEGVWNDTEWQGTGDDKHHEKRDFYRKYRYDFKCDAWKHEVLNPVHCDVWYDEDYELLDNMHLYECTANDMITLSPTALPTVSPTAVVPTCADVITIITSDGDDQARNINDNASGNTNASVIVGVLLCVVGAICCVISIWLYFKGRDNRKARGEVVNSKDDEMEITTQTDGGKYDMSPLNTVN